MIRWAAVEGHLLASVQEIWGSYIGRGLVIAEFNLLAGHSRFVRGQMRIDGVWEGILYLECSEPLARQVAMAMFGASSEALTIAEIHDAWAEVTNMVGGGVKHALPPPIRLSLPRVDRIDRGDEAVSVEQVRMSIGFLCEREPFRVGIL